MLAICSCANPSPKPIATLPITADLIIPLPPLTDMNGLREVTQLINVHYQLNRVVFEAHISITPEEFVMVGLDGFGRKAITIHWTKDGVIYEAAPFVPQQLRPENILADIVLLYLPKNSLQKLLAGSQLKLLTTANSRTIMQGDKKILEVHYKLNMKNNFWNGSLHYQHFIWGYDMDIKSVEDAK